jgi:hypothetical protein
MLLVGLSGKLFVVVTDVLPLLESICPLDYLLLKCLVILLVLPQMLLLFSLIHKDMIRLMFILLMINGLEVAVLSISFLQVKLLLEFNVSNVGIHFDDVVPKLLLLVVGLLDLANCDIR